MSAIYNVCDQCEQEGFEPLCRWKRRCIVEAAAANEAAEIALRVIHYCTTHPERVAVAVGLNCRRCVECQQDALARYADRRPQWQDKKYTIHDYFREYPR